MGRKIHRKKQTKPTLASAEKENIWLAVKIILAILVFGFLAAFFLHDIYFVNADLGRHIKNGELFITEGTIVSSNYYSYTEPDFPTITHHWGTGVIFYWVVNLFGFKGLTIFYLSLIHI